MITSYDTVIKETEMENAVNLMARMNGEDFAKAMAEISQRRDSNPDREEAFEATGMDPKALVLHAMAVTTQIIIESGDELKDYGSEEAIAILDGTFYEGKAPEVEPRAAVWGLYRNRDDEADFYTIWNFLYEIVS